MEGGWWGIVHVELRESYQALVNYKLSPQAGACGYERDMRTSQSIFSHICFL